MIGNVRSWLKLLLLLSDEVIVVFVALFVLWKLGVKLHPGVLAATASVVIAIVFLSYKILWPALTDRQVPNPSGVIGLDGEVVKPLSPEGVVKVRGELWKAAATNAEAEVGQRVRVVGLEGLKLLVEVKSTDMESGFSSQRVEAINPTSINGCKGIR